MPDLKLRVTSSQVPLPRGKIDSLLGATQQLLLACVTHVDTDTTLGVIAKELSALWL